MKRWPAVAFGVALSCWWMPQLASAHEVGLSRGEYATVGDDVSLAIWFARSEVDQSLARRLAERVRVVATDTGRACSLQPNALATSDDGQGVLVRSAYTCPHGERGARVEADFFQLLPRGHRHVTRISDAVGVRELVLSEAQPTFEVGMVAAPVSKPAAAPALGDFVRLGFEHILGGYDHLLFLFGLVLARSRLAELLKVISAFTLAHSLTLGCAALGWWAPAPRLVEPAIALSIALVAWENLRRVEPRRRSLVTFGFGLVHGFGFAGALLELELPMERVPKALLGFNLGVELGQLLVAGLLALGLRALRRAWHPLTARSTELVLNGGILAAGLIWLVLRVRAGYLT